MPHRQISEIFSTHIRSVTPVTSIADALRLMRDHRVSCVPVVLNDTPIGILTERDLLRSTDKILAGRELAVREIMSQPVLTIGQKALAGDALIIMRENRIRHLIVSDDGCSIVGILTQTDLLKKIAENCFFKKNTVAMVMSKKVRTVKLGTTIMRVLHEMASNNLSCIVVEENDRPQGIITERDLVWLLTEKPELWSLLAEDIMSIPVTTVATTTTPHEAVTLMNLREIRHLVVVDDAEKIAGIVTQSLLCRELNCPASSS